MQAQLYLLGFGGLAVRVILVRVFRVKNAVSAFDCHFEVHDKV